MLLDTEDWSKMLKVQFCHHRNKWPLPPFIFAFSSVHFKIHF